MVADPSYNPNACCGDHCYEFYAGVEAQDGADPCWGDVEAIDEYLDGDDGFIWIHACRGHRDTWDGGAYIPKPEIPAALNSQG
jgi:hypothetical protein